MIELDLETTEPSVSLDMITLDTVRPFLALKEGKTGQGRWLNAVIVLLTLSPRERAVWLIGSSAEGAYPVHAKMKQEVVWKRILHELDMVKHADEPGQAFSNAAKDWVSRALGDDELIMEKDGKEEFLTGDQLRFVVRKLLCECPIVLKSLRNHVLKFKSVDAWFTHNHDLIAEEAWEHDWMELLSG